MWSLFVMISAQAPFIINKLCLLKMLISFCNFKIFIGTFFNIFQIGQTDATFFLDSGLEPFTFYSYTVRACTAVGCGDSDHTMIQTEQDTPTGLAPPRITEIDSTWVNVEWANPTDANGIISE